MDNDQSQTANEAYIRKVSSTHPANYLSIALLIIGAIAFTVGVGVKIERISPVLRAVQAKQGSSLIDYTSWVIVGILLLVTGVVLFRLRRKIDRLRVSDTLHRTLYIWDSSMKEWPTTPSSIWIDPTGIGKDSEDRPFITWSEVTDTKWRFIYTRDSYQINTATKAYLFSFTNPYTAKKEEMAYVMSSGVGKGAQLAGSAYIGISNMKDIDILQALHIYARCYVKQGVSFWHNKFEEIFFKFMFAIMASFAIMTLQYSTLSVIYPGQKNFGFVMEIAPVIACAYFVYIALKDLVYLRKSIVNNI